MKKILIILLSCFLLLSCDQINEQVKNNKDILYELTNEKQEETFIKNVIQESNFKCVQIGDTHNMIFYKVFVTQKSKNGNFVHEYLVSKYIGYNVSVQEITCYNDSLNNLK